MTEEMLKLLLLIKEKYKLWRLPILTTTIYAERAVATCLPDDYFIFLQVSAEINGGQRQVTGTSKAKVVQADFLALFKAAVCDLEIKLPK